MGVLKRFDGAVAVPSSQPHDSAGTIRHQTTDAFAAANNHLYTVRGIDTVDNRVLAIDSGAGQLKQSANWGGSWSTSKGLPADVSSANVSIIVRFGNYLWLLGTQTSDAAICIWRASPASGNTAFTWTKVHTYVAGSTDFTPNLAADASYLYAAEYGDPVPDPSLYRISLSDANGAGTNWVNIKTFASIRHIHCVAPDPFNAGHVWVALGDGVANRVQWSEDYGSTWTAVPHSDIPQLVSLAHTETHVVGYGDGSGNEVGLVAVEKASKTWFGASFGRVEFMAMPGGTHAHGHFFDGVATSGDATFTSASASFQSTDVGKTIKGQGIPAGTTVLSRTSATEVELSANASASVNPCAFYIERPLTFATPIGRIVADPDTGAVYFHSGTSTASPWAGLFVVPFLGGPIICLHVGNSNNPPTPSSCFIGNGRVFSGEADIPLIEIT